MRLFLSFCNCAVFDEKSKKLFFFFSPLICLNVSIAYWNCYFKRCSASSHTFKIEIVGVIISGWFLFELRFSLLKKKRQQENDFRSRHNAAETGQQQTTKTNRPFLGNQPVHTGWGFRITLLKIKSQQQRQKKKKKRKKTFCCLEKSSSHHSN